MGKFKTNLTITILLFVAGACTGTKVVSDQAINSDLTQYQTFAYLPAKSDMSQEEKKFDYDYSAVIKAMDEITEEMRNIGYEMDLENPDLLIITHTIFSQDETLQREPVASNYPYYTPAFEKAFDYPYYYKGYEGISQVYGYDIDEVEPKHGALVVDFIDAKTHQLLWRGWITNDFSPEELKENLRVYIDKIFQEFPIQSK